MDLRQLRQFVALSESLNFHKAADALNMTQPPLSVSIRKLEDELGAPLFERHARGVTLTEAAIAALPHAREAIAAAEAVQQALRDLATGVRGRLRLGFVGSATYDLLPAIVSIFRIRHPGVDLSLREATSVEVVRGLEEGALDAGLVRTPLLRSASVELTPLRHEDLILIVPKDHWLDEDQVIPVGQLKDEAFIAYDQEQAANLWNLMMISCETAGFFPKVVEESAHVHTMIALVESGLGIAMAPAIMRRAAAGRVKCVRFSVGGSTPQIGMALATRPEEARAFVRAFATVVEEASQAL